MTTPTLNRTRLHALPFARTIGAAALAGILLTTAACGSSDDGATSSTTAAEGSDGSGSEGSGTFPMTIDNCGEEITLDAPPTKAVTMNQGATEIMLALGLEDQMAGTAYIDDAVLPEWQEAYDSVPVLAEEYPSQETVLASGTDFVYGSYVSAFDDEAAGSRSSLADQGIGTYLSPNDCRAEEGTPITFDDVFAEIEEIGDVFGVPERADALIAESKDRLAAATEDLPEGTSIFWYDSGEDAPLTGACCGAPAMIIDQVGGTNIFEDLDGGWGDGSWERVVDADPEVIVLIDAAWDTREAKDGVLGEPPLDALSAVSGERFVEIAYSSSTPGVRNVLAVEQLADGLRNLDQG